MDKQQERQQISMHWTYLITAGICLWVMGFSENARGPLYPDILRSLHLNDTEGGAMFAASCMGTAIGGPLFRLLVSRTHAIRCMQYGLVIASLGLYMTAIAQSLSVLLIASLIYGTGAGGLGLIQNIMVKQGASLEKRRQALAGLHSIYGLASLMAPLGVRALASISFDWRDTLILFAVIPIIMGIILQGVRPLPSAEDSIQPQPVSLRFRYRQLKIGLVVGGAVTAELAISTRLVALLERSGYDPDGAALGLAAFFLCLLLGRLSCSVANNPLSNRTLLYLSATLSVLFFVLGLTISPLILPLVALPLGPFVPVIFDLMANEFPEHFEGTLAFSVAVVSTMLVISHQLIGLFTDIWTMNSALFWGVFTLLFSLIILPRTVDRDDANRPSPEE